MNLIHKMSDMSLTLYILIVIAVLAMGYFVYGRMVSRFYRLDDSVETPATTMNDGADYIPTPPGYLLSQHFSAIAAAGPIVGPILACIYFGWGPCLLWILLGVVLIGAVHDFSSLIVSVRHGATSIAEIVRQNLGPRGYYAILIFLWLALVYVIVAFTDATASTFLGIDKESGFEKGGAVATSATAYLGLAIVMGLCQRLLKMPLWLATLIFVPATLAVVALGTYAPMPGLSGKTWGILILVYCGLASVAPMWSLLQPRGYLGGFVLYMVLALGVAGILFGSFTIQQPFFKEWGFQDGEQFRPLFPLLFVTIACGACSGFHGLVCSGTTSKQIARESHTRMIGYGGMLLEGFVAAISLATIMMVAPVDAGQKYPPPGTIYGNGIGGFLMTFIGPDYRNFAITFGTMAFCTFVFDTLDVTTRLGRYILQELFGWKGKAGGIGATVLMLGLPMIMLISVYKEGAYRDFWDLFGSSNQLLAALTLMVVTVWLYRNGKKFWVTLIPAIFMFILTLWSLALIIMQSVRYMDANGMAFNTTVINGFVALALIGVTGILILDALRAVRRHNLTASAST